MEIPPLRELLLAVLDSVERMAIENAKMRVIIHLQHSSKNEPWGIDVDEEIRATVLDGTTEALLRSAYAQLRQAIQQQSDPEQALLKLLEQFPKQGNTN